MRFSRRRIDQYATLEQLHRIQAGAPGAVQRVEPRAQPSPHLEAPDETIAAIAAFVSTLA